jgi:hypothetical protein
MSSLFSIDPMMYEEMMSTFSGTQQFTSTMGSNSQDFGQMPPVMTQMDTSGNVRAQEDLNTLAMWSNAPTGFEYVSTSFRVRVLLTANVS